MIIVSDTSPLRYLIEVDAVHVLPVLYGDVRTTSQVIDELRLEHFPQKVQQWAENPPAWLKIQKPRNIEFLDRLDEGEASAISLARECAADVVLIDERAGCEVARSVGLKASGTLAVLQDAGLEKLIDFHQAIHILTHQTKFRYDKMLIDRVLVDYEKRLWERTDPDPHAEPQ